MIADVYDAVQGVAYTVACAAGGKHRPRKPKPYPRPAARRRVRMGGGAIPASSFDAWWGGK